MAIGGRSWRRCTGARVGGAVRTGCRAPRRPPASRSGRRCSPSAGTAPGSPACRACRDLQGTTLSGRRVQRGRGLHGGRQCAGRDLRHLGLRHTAGGRRSASTAPASRRSGIPDNGIAVFCGSATKCVAIDGQTFGIEQWTGTRWRLGPTTSIALSAVSCPTASGLHRGRDGTRLQRDRRRAVERHALVKATGKGPLQRPQVQRPDHRRCQLHARRRLHARRLVLRSARAPTFRSARSALWPERAAARCRAPSSSWSRRRAGGGCRSRA